MIGRLRRGHGPCFELPLVASVTWIPPVAGPLPVQVTEKAERLLFAEIADVRAEQQDQCRARGVTFHRLRKAFFIGAFVARDADSADRVTVL